MLLDIDILILQIGSEEQSCSVVEFHYNSERDKARKELLIKLG